MSVEISNVIEAMFAFQGNAMLAPQLLAGAGVKAATFVRTGVGVYTIDLEQPLTLDLPALPAQGRVDYAFAANPAIGNFDIAINVSLIAGDVPGVFDRVRVNTLVAGVQTDVTGFPISVMVFRFPNVV
jgi:hypothetical protein